MVSHLMASDTLDIDALAAAPVRNCNALIKFAASCCVVAYPATSAMFFFRVRGVYCNNRIITLFFGFLLFALFALSFIMPVVAKATHIGPTQRCINATAPRYISTPIILNSIIDTLVFVAISFRIMSLSLAGDTFGARMGSFFRGNGLPVLSRSVLQGGQLYYLCVCFL